MVGEEAADEVVAVADARRHHVVRRQQQPRILHRAGREHDDLRLHGELPAVERRDVEMIEARGIRREAQAGHVGVEIGGEMRDALQVVGIAMCRNGSAARCRASC